jgi:methylglyoxal/glyoxal reductase
MKITSIADRVALHNGVEMPWFGLGVFRAEEGNEVFNAVCHAAACGYRSIDTAAVYGNEEGVGRALRACGVPRDEMFVTTKVWNSDQGHDTTLRAFDASLERLGLDTVDLYLVHWPVTGRFTETWRALERMYAEGRARAIGVSNFLEHHLDTLLQRAEVVPMVNQVEFHPRLVQPGLLAKCDALGIRLEAWSPIMRGKVDEIPELQEIAARHGKSPAQVTLRWDLQHGVVTIPKSVRPERIASNADVFDFELAPEEMAAIDALDRNERLGPDPDTF